MTMDSYTLAKGIHVLSVVCSISLFFVRGIWHLRDSPRLGHRWVKIVPHAVDTLLLASAGWLMVITQQYPGVVDWLTVKLVAVVVYIGLGMVAFRFARTRSLRLAAWLSALLVFALIVWLALSR